MKLDQFAVVFPNYPWLPPFKPFNGWGATGKPTQELAWYDDYNATKHDRESAFERATLCRVTDLDNLPEPDELAEEIIENLEAGLNSFREVLAGLNKVA